MSALADAETAWLALAACRGKASSMWFSVRPIEQAAAVTLCRSCSVRRECLAEALALEAGEPLSFGIRGGLLAHERRKLLDHGVR